MSLQSISDPLRTEGEVSAYVKKVTAILHPHGAKHPEA